MGADAAGSREPLGQHMEWWTSQAESAKPASVTWGGSPRIGPELPCLPTGERTPTGKPPERLADPTGKGRVDAWWSDRVPWLGRLLLLQP